MGCGTKRRKAMHQASRGHRSPDARRVPRITLEEEGETGTTFSFNNKNIDINFDFKIFFKMVRLPF